MNTKTVLTVNEQCGSAASVAQTSKSSSIGRNRREARRFFVYASQVAKRLECVQLAGAVGSAWGVGKREQAPRTPNASRDLVAVPPRCATRENAPQSCRIILAAHKIVAGANQPFCRVTESTANKPNIAQSMNQEFYC